MRPWVLILTLHISRTNRISWDKVKRACHAERATEVDLVRNLRTEKTKMWIKINYLRSKVMKRNIKTFWGNTIKFSIFSHNFYYSYGKSNCSSYRFVGMLFQIINHILSIRKINYLCSKVMNEIWRLFAEMRSNSVFSVRIFMSRMVRVIVPVIVSLIYSFQVIIQI